jgi:hypothetical protein
VPDAEAHNTELQEIILRRRAAYAEVKQRHTHVAAGVCSAMH